MKMKLLVLICTVTLLVTTLGISVRTERRSIMVADELHTTESEPEVIVVNNSVFSLESVPNRGRPVARVVMDDVDLLYFNPYPMPYLDEETGSYIMEFGGLYFSIPWNPRSVQPYGLNYEVIQKEDEVTIVCKGMNPTNKLLGEMRVSVRDGERNVKIEISVTNLSDEDKNIQLSVYVNFPFGEGFNIVSSLKNIDGLAMKDFPTTSKMTLKAEEGYIGVFNKKLNEGLIGEFKGMNDHNLLIWGLDYEEHLGGGEFFKVRHNWPSVELKKGEARRFKYLLKVVDLQTLERKCKERE